MAYNFVCNFLCFGVFVSFGEGFFVAVVDGAVSVTVLCSKFNYYLSIFIN